MGRDGSFHVHSTLLDGTTLCRPPLLARCLAPLLSSTLTPSTALVRFLAAPLPSCTCRAHRPGAARPRVSLSPRPRPCRSSPWVVSAVYTAVYLIASRPSPNSVIVPLSTSPHQSAGVVKSSFSGVRRRCFGGGCDELGRCFRELLPSGEQQMLSL